ncbi:MAG: epoxyqueuosine reductase QueH [Lachnospiraceae bacterium]|nr:epoxyqueuosine reductase QueH [Lachnospiraceae bacterium]
MENKRNYQRELDEIIAHIDPEHPKKLLLHGCCAPCSSYVLEYLTDYFDITIFYYNPNIYEYAEYQHRVAEMIRLISEQPYKHKPQFIEGTYEPERFYEVARGLENEPERGRRCYECYKLRLTESARIAEKIGAEYFASTLSISPMKNAVWLNEIGENLQNDYNVKHLPSEFKKKNGYKRSIELSCEYCLYRQDFCGCIFSKNERDRRQREKAAGQQDSAQS